MTDLLLSGGISSPPNINWAEVVDADRVDLSATPEGQRIYERVGFTLTSAPRMKLVL